MLIEYYVMRNPSYANDHIEKYQPYQKEKKIPFLVVVGFNKSFTNFDIFVKRLESEVGINETIDLNK